ncbi:MAG: hypothetical protein IJU15_01780 [Synergistaceae bacterium]|nr:hypothetical protein [Synergistaceae bacterium]
MKKFLLCIMCMLLCGRPCFAEYDQFSDNRAERRKAEAFYRKMDILVEEVSGLATKILAYNKPLLEVGVNKDMNNRVCAKDKTLVIGFSWKKMNYEPGWFVTRDPEFVFKGGIRVGANVKVLERFLGDTIMNVGRKEGKRTIVIGPLREEPDAPQPVSIICENGIITEISYNWAYNFPIYESEGGVYTKKAVDFANRTATKMNLSILK